MYRTRVSVKLIFLVLVVLWVCGHNEAAICSLLFALYLTGMWRGQDGHTMHSQYRGRLHIFAPNIFF